MKITVLFGDDTGKIAQRNHQIADAVKARGWRIESVSDTGLKLAEIFSATSLFEEQKLFIIDDLNYFSDADLTWLKENESSISHNLLILHKGNLSAKLKSSLPKTTKFEEFKLPVKLWEFLDSLYAGNVKASLKLFHQCLVSEPGELLISLIGTTFRDLYWAKTDPDSLKLPSWRKSKLIRQSGKFDSKQLKLAVEELAKLDVESKTLDINLGHRLDLFLAKSLQ